MASNSFFSGRIPPELHQSVKDYCEESGKSQTKVLIEALSNYLNIPIENRNSKNDEVTKEMYNSLLERIEILEEKLNENNVINSDNTNKYDEEFLILVKENIYKILREKEEESTANIKGNNEAKLNNSENKEAIKIETYKNIDNKELSELTNIDASERKNLKNQALKKAQKQGYKIIENLKFKQPIQMTYRKGIKINGSEYKLLCEGIDAYKMPIWSLIPDDTISYQLDIIKSSIS